jgi:cyclic pyranopterin phosphate synthase
MPEGEELDYILKQDLLTDEELLTLLREVFIPLGWSKFRLTGGEPLLRPEVVNLVKEIASWPETEDLAMTSNGFLLPEMAQDLYDAGLKRLNISLDSLQKENFEKIIGNGSKTRWERVWHGIQTAFKVGFDPLKLNVVVIPGFNDGEVLDLAALTMEKNWHVRFIEFMPIGNQQLFGDRSFIPSAEIRQQIRDKWGLIESTVKGNGPANVFKIPNSQGTLGFISQMSECFCDSCNRMRLSADGWLRPCLLNEKEQIDLKNELRTGLSIAEIREKVKQVLILKPEINFTERDPGTDAGNYTRTMSQIGG